jgi:hypothetical protein
LETAISFDATDCPKSMEGAGQLPLLVSPTIANIKLYHILIDGCAPLNLISLTAFKKLQISMLKLQPSCPFSGVGSVVVMPCGCISLPVTFGMPGNFHTESVLFDVAEVNLQFNAILGRPVLYQFMAVAHYGYLVLRMLTPTTSSRSVETMMKVSLCCRSSRLWQQPVRLLQGMGTRTWCQ